MDGGGEVGWGSQDWGKMYWGRGTNRVGDSRGKGMCTWQVDNSTLVSSMHLGTVISLDQELNLIRRLLGTLL